MNKAIHTWKQYMAYMLCSSEIQNRAVKRQISDAHRFAAQAKTKVEPVCWQKSLPEGIKIDRNGQTPKLTVNKAKKEVKYSCDFAFKNLKNITFGKFRVSNEYFTEKPTFLQFTFVLFLNGFSVQKTTATDKINNVQLNKLIHNV